MVVYIVPLIAITSLEKLNSYSNILSLDEFNYWHSILNPKFRREYFISKILTRLFLSKYLNGTIAPKDLVFVKGEFGKPFLSPKFKALNVFFNVSHCDDLYTIAIGNRSIGVDVESYKFIANDNLAEIVFSPSEMNKTLDMTAVEKNTFLVKTWTIKESYSKEMGLGVNISFPLCSVEQLANGFYNVSSDFKTNKDILIKNMTLIIKDVHYSLSISTHLKQFSTLLIENIDNENWCFKDDSFPLPSKISYTL